MKHLKWSFIVLFALALSACYLDEPFYGNSGDQVVHQNHEVKKGNGPEGKVSTSVPAQTTERVSSGKAPAQKEMPGPKRAAAPQIPVVVTQ